MNTQAEQRELELAALESKLRTIEEGLSRLAPVRAKTDEPIKPEDSGEQERREWKRLWDEKEDIEARIRLCEEELSRLYAADRE